MNGQETLGEPISEAVLKANTEAVLSYVAARLRAARAAADLIQDAVCRQAGISAPTLRSIETGQPHGIDALLRACYVLGLRLRLEESATP